MKTTENISRRTGQFRRAVTLFAIAATLSIAAFMLRGSGLVQADDASPETAAGPQRGPAVKPRSGHSDYLRGLTRSALQQGFGKDEVLLLAPQRGPGREVTARRLRAIAASRNNLFGRRLSAVGLKPAPTDDRNLAFVGPNSYLKISADGTKFVFRGNIDNPREIERARRGGRMIEKDELERLGRRFVQDALRDFVKMGAEESLTFLGIKYLRDGDFDEGGRGEEEIIANIAIFGREVRGVPVVGSGSKVAVWFANDRQPIGFDVDWPIYKTLETRQKVLTRERLSERVKATTIETTGSTRGEVARFECGYVDLGGRKRGEQIQSGCAIHYAGRNDDGSLWARIEFVPAAETVVADPAWPLARLIASGRTINTNSPEFVSYVSKNRPPAVDRSPDSGPR